MSTEFSNKAVYTEIDIQNAISTYKLKRFPSIQAVSYTSGIPYSTLCYHMSGQSSRAQAHEHCQILSKAEERTLVQWITCLIIAGFPASPALVIQMAEEIRIRHIQLAKASPASSLNLCPIGHNWLQ
jgi:hypothetical protein